VITTYRAILAMPGAAAFVTAGFVARLAHLTTVLGTVFLVSSRTGSYGSAGLVSAAYALSYSVVAPLLSRRADRHRQSQVLVAAAIATAVSRGGLLVAVWLDAPVWSLVSLSAASGASMPAVGPFVRARWAHLLRGSPRSHTAASFESVLDEILLIIGPVVVSTLVVYLHPAAGLVLALPLAVGGLLTLAWQPATQPPVAAHRVRGTALTTPGLPALLLTFALVSAMITMVELGVVAFASQHAAAAWSGWILGVLAVGSAVSGLWYGARERSPSLRRPLLALAVGTVPFVAAPTTMWLFPAAFLLGLAVAPTLIAGYSVVGEVVTPRNLTEGLTWMTTAAGVGISAGSAVTGWVVDAWGTRAVFALATGCAAVAVASGLRAVSRWRGAGRPGRVRRRAARRRRRRRRAPRLSTG